MAYNFGQRHAEEPAVLIMRLPGDVFNELEASNKVFTRPIAGAEEFTETIFTPESFNILNQHTTFPKIVDPHGRR